MLDSTQILTVCEGMKKAAIRTVLLKPTLWTTQCPAWTVNVTALAVRKTSATGAKQTSFYLVSAGTMSTFTEAFDLYLDFFKSFI